MKLAKWLNLIKTELKEDPKILIYDQGKEVTFFFGRNFRAL